MGVTKILHTMKTFLTISMMVTMTYTLPQPQQTYQAVHGALISGISQEIVGLGITHGICEVDPAGNGVVHGSCEVYPIHPNPLFSKRWRILLYGPTRGWPYACQ